MTGFLGSYLLGLFAVGLMLYGLYAVARLMTRRRFSGTGRLLRVIESIALTPNCALHVVQASDRRWLIGSSSDRVTVLTELQVKNT